MVDGCRWVQWQASQRGGVEQLRVQLGVKQAGCDPVSHEKRSETQGSPVAAAPAAADGWVPAPATPCRCRWLSGAGAQRGRQHYEDGALPGYPPNGPICPHPQHTPKSSVPRFSPMLCVLCPIFLSYT